MKYHISYNMEADSQKAGAQAAAETAAHFAGTTPDLLLLFCSIAHDISALIRSIRSQLQTETGTEIPLCGCTGSGIISHLGANEATHSMVLIAVQSSKIRFTPFLFEHLERRPEEIGRKIAALIREQGLHAGDPQLLLAFSDAFTLNAAPLFSGLREELGYHIDCAGGSAGNDYHISNTLQFAGEQIVSDAFCGVLVHGGLHCHLEVSHGSKPYGSFRTITKAEKNTVFEIDGKPALPLLKQFLGEERFTDFGKLLNLIGLGVEFQGENYHQDIIVRTVFGLNEEDGSIKLGTSLPVGTRFRMNRRDKRTILTETANMAQSTWNSLNRPGEALWLYFNCSGRGAYLFGETEPDINSLASVLPPAHPFAGFFTFGEFAPVNGTNYFHNYTGVLVGIEEDD